MFGALVFYHVYLNLGEECRNKILRNIFHIDNVSVSDVVLRENAIIFRIFAEGVYYQYVFDLNVGDGRDYSKFSRVKNIVYGYVSVSTYPRFRKLSLFSLLLEIFLCQEEYRIYRLMRWFL